MQRLYLASSVAINKKLTALSLLVLCQAEGVVAAVESNKLRLEENIAVDGQVGSTAGLNASEASCEADVSILLKFWSISKPS